MAADIHTQFELLYGDLRAFHDSFVDGSIKVAGFQIIVVGWLVTSADARAALKASTAIPLLAIGALLLGIFIYAFIVVRVYGLSQHTFRLLNSLGYMPPSHYQSRTIKAVTAGMFILANALLTLVGCVLAGWHLL